MLRTQVLAVLLALSGASSGCSGIDIALSCSTICRKVRECVDDELSERTCSSQCQDAVEEHDLRDAADDCQHCTEDNACAKIPERCSSCEEVLQSFTDKRF
jgi:hypothetical protein